MATWIFGAASPFDSWEAFEGAVDGPTGGAIYTFADRPALTGIMIVVAALIFIYFLYATFNIKAGHSQAKSPPMLGLLLLAGASSVMVSVYEGVAERRVNPQTSRSAETGSMSPAPKLPAALVGMAGIIGGKRKRSPRRIRSDQ